MPRVARFGKFEFDLDRELLRRSGLSVRLPPQPSRLLALLVERAGQVVTREEIQRHLWPDGTHVDYEQGINHSIRQIRSVLGDDAATGRFVQTVPKVGYRFFGVVEYVEGNGHHQGASSVHQRSPSPPGTSGAAHAKAPRRTSLTRLVLPMAMAAIFLGLLVGIPGVGVRESAEPSIRLKRLTSHGRVNAAALSPDGKHFVDARFEEEGFAIYMNSLETGISKRIAERIPTRLQAIGFYPDGERIYYVRPHNQGPGYSSLYEVPALGGPAQELVFDIDSGVGFSPDGKRMAYIRWFPFQSESALVTAHLDGTGERTAGLWKGQGSFAPRTPAWSPDGKRIAVIGRLPRADARFALFVVDVESGERVRLGDGHWDRLTGIAWSYDGREVLIAAESPGMEDRPQIWRVSYPRGQPARLTNDLDSYRSLSASSDGRSILTILREPIANLHSVAMEDGFPITHWTTGNLPRDLVLCVRSLHDGSIIYTTREEDRYQFWRTRSPRRSRTPLLPDSHTGSAAFELSADAESIVYVAPDENETPQLFTLSVSGGIPVRITSGAGVAVAGACSGQGPFFLRPLGGDGLWRIDGPGEAPRRISGLTPWSTPPYCSPDRQHLMFGTFKEKDGLFERYLVILSTGGGEPVHQFAWSDGFLPLWSPTGDAVTFVRHDTSGSDVFGLDVESGEIARLTDLEGGFIFSWDWRNGGSSLVASRGRVNADVVLINADHPDR